MRTRVVLILVILWVTTCSAGDSHLPRSLAEAIERASQLSQITLPGSAPFHLKATIAELDSPESDYKAEIDEYWLAPNKWKRTVKTPDFSQTIIVNGRKISEQDDGDYYPFWLQGFITAIFDLVPDEIKQLKGPMPDMAALQAQKTKSLPPALRNLHFDTGKFCLNLNQTAGIAPVHNTLFGSICFTNPPGLLTSVLSPEFHAEFSDFKEFKGKQVARKISTDPEPGTKIEAKVTELTELGNPDLAIFSIQSETPAPEHITTVKVNEKAARDQLQNSPEIAWEPVRDGKTSGTLSLLVSIDRKGHVRETWPLNSDNPFPQDQARKEVAKWKFKPMSVDGAPVQMETILTFAFETKIGNPIPVLSDADARKQATATAEPDFRYTKPKPPSGTKFTIRAAMDENGRLMGVNNPYKVETNLFLAGYGAVSKWKFRPYLVNGKPDRFDADITFQVP